MNHTPNRQDQNLRLLADLSHDLRSPIATIMGYTTLLRECAQDPSVSDIDPEPTQAIGRNASRLLSLIDDVTDWAKLQTGQLIPSPSQLDLSQVIAEAIEPLQSFTAPNNFQTNQILHVLDDNTPPNVYSDPQLLPRLIRCLILCSAGPENKAVSVHVGSASNPPCSLKIRIWQSITPSQSPPDTPQTDPRLNSILPPRLQLRLRLAEELAKHLQIQLQRNPLDDPSADWILEL